MPTEELIDWMTYFTLKEERERHRMIEALAFVAQQLFRKEGE
jgi:hypothetical protein